MATVIPKHIPLKAFGMMFFIGVFFGIYFYLLKHPAYSVTVMQVTQLDKLISFQPLALPVYLSLWGYLALPLMFLSTRKALFEYGLAMVLMCITGLIIFYFWPTAAPIATIDWTQYPSVHFLKNLDASGNACPSLHVSTALFSGIWLNYLLRRFNAPAWVRIINWIWCIGILYSTIATRQHVVVDVVGGIVLGGLAAMIASLFILKDTENGH